MVERAKGLRAGAQQCCEVPIREGHSDMGSSQQKVFIRQPENILDVQDPSIALSLSQGEHLSTKATSWVDTPQQEQLARIRTTEAKKQG